MQTNIKSAPFNSVITFVQFWKIFQWDDDI